VYVVDTGNGVVDKFGATGSYISQLGGFSGELLGVAVDSSGDLWVYSDEAAGEGQVSEFDEAGISVKSPFDTGRGTTPALAVDSADNVYLTAGGQTLFKYDASGGEEQGTSIAPACGLAIDLATNDLYVDLGTSLAQYGAFGEPFSEPLYRSGVRSSMVAGRGVAVDSTSHEVYVADSSTGQVDVFALGATAAKPKTLKAKVEGSVVTLEGELEGGESGYYFAYDDNGSCEGAAQTAEGDATGTALKETATISGGLEPNTQYMFCTVATNAYGQEPGPPLPFMTEPVAPLIEETSTPYVGVFEATVEAKIDPENDETTCRVEYGETTAYGAEAPCEQANLGGHGGQPATMRLKNLKASTTYHYRVVAENAVMFVSGPSEGVGELTTAPELEGVIEAESVSVESGKETEPRTVTFEAQVDPELQSTTSCAFEYGKIGAAYEASAPCEQSSQQIGDGSTGVPVSAKVTGLEAGADYHYRFVVDNKTSPTDGADQVFGPPTAVTGGVLSEVPGVPPGTTATVGGEVDPESLETFYYVQYGTSADEFAQTAPFLPPGIDLPLGIEAGSGVTPVILASAGGPPDISLEGLTPGAVYRYRLVAANADGTTYGKPETITVPPTPLVGPATVTEVTQTSAKITTSVDPGGLHTLYK
ncbi:MAG: hypothetical protein WCC64_15240, partial [Aliidongia sp.]